MDSVVESETSTFQYFQVQIYNFMLEIKWHEILPTQLRQIYYQKNDGRFNLVLFAVKLIVYKL